MRHKQIKSRLLIIKKMNFKWKRERDEEEKSAPTLCKDFLNRARVAASQPASNSFIIIIARKEEKGREERQLR